MIFADEDGEEGGEEGGDGNGKKGDDDNGKKEEEEDGPLEELLALQAAGEKFDKLVDNAVGEIIKLGGYTEFNAYYPYGRSDDGVAAHYFK